MDVIIGFIVADKPGVIQKLSNAVSENGGNWLESRMSQLGGFFSGVVKIEITEAELPALTISLKSLQEFTVTIREPVTSSQPVASQLVRLNIIGPDRPGILREVSNKLADKKVNVIEMETSVHAAPMSGGPIFEADAEVAVGNDTDMAKLVVQLDALADELGVDILLEDIGQSAS